MGSASELSFDDLPGGPDPSQRKSARALSFDDIPGGDTSIATDIGKSVAAAIPKAVVGLAGVPRDLSDLGSIVRNKLTSFLYNDWQSGVTKADAAIRAVNPVDVLARYMPGSQQLRSAAENVTGPWYDPQTRAGKIADVGTQTLAMMGRNLVTTPLRALGTAGGMTAGNQVAGAYTDDNPWAMLFGGLLGGAPVAAVNARVNAAPKALKQAIGDISQPEIDAAIAKQNTANAQGIPLMGSESLPVSGIQPLTADIASSRSGGAVINPYLAKRPDQVRGAVRGLLEQTGAPNDPAVNAARAQAAATGVISDAEMARTAAASPLYEAAANETLPEQALRPVANEIQGLLYRSPQGAQSEQALGNWYKQLFPYSTPRAELPAAQAAALPETNVGRLHDLYRTLKIEGDTSNIGASTADKVAAYPAQQVRSALGDVLNRESPTFAAAERMYGDITKNTIDPLTSGPMGVVAGKAGFDPSAPSPIPRVTSAIANADVARPDTIRALYTQLNAKDPQAFPGLARTWLENSFDKATQRIQSGDNRMMGANFAKTVYGTDQERKNLQEVLRGVAKANGADPDAFVAGADKLMQTLEATGKVPGVGSPTSSRTDLQVQLSKNLPSTIASNTNPFKIPETIGNKISAFVNAKRNGQIARMLTEPNSVQQIVRMAKLNPNGLTARYYAAALLGVDRAVTD